MQNSKVAARIVFLVHYFPPINSSGAKRVEALSKYMAKLGRTVTVVTTRKSGVDGAFTENFPPMVEVIQLNWLGVAGDLRLGTRRYEPMYGGKPSLGRRFKECVTACFGQIPDPRLPFAFCLLSPFLDRKARRALAAADVVVGSSPPWPMLLAALFVRLRFRKPIILDYRDQFSGCHGWPGSFLAKFVERVLDKALAAQASAVVTVSQPMAGYYADFNQRVSVVMNGYDPEAIAKARAEAALEPRASNRPIVIRYLGWITPSRVPLDLLRAVQNLSHSGVLDLSRLRFEVFGTGALLKTVLESDFPSLLPCFRFEQAVAYGKSLRLMATADHLLFAETSSLGTTSAQGILTTKLFEYLAIGRPILADISRETVIGGMIAKAGAVHFVSNVQSEFEHYLQTQSFWEPGEADETPFVKTLSREAQAEQYIAIMEEACQRRL